MNKRRVKWDNAYQAWEEGGVWWVWRGGAWKAESLGDRMWDMLLMAYGRIYVPRET